MKKELRGKFIKIVVLTILILFVLTCLIFNYMVFGKFSLSVNLVDCFNDKNSYNNVEFDKAYIYNHKMVQKDYNKNIKMTTYTYLLDLKEIPDDIFSISFNLDSKLKSSDKFMINIFTDKEVYYYDQTNFYKNNDVNKTLLVLHDNIYRVSIMSDMKLYDDEVLEDSEILFINNIKFNDRDDIVGIKRNMLIDLLKSILLSSFIVGIILLIFKSEIDKKLFKKKLKIENLFLVLSIVMGVIFSFLFPLYQIPDELTHINLIYDELNLDFNFEEASNYYGDTDRIIRNYSEKVNLKEYFDFSKRLDAKLKLNIPSIYIVRHLPQMIGLIGGGLLKLPVLVCITISEILAVLFYTFVCYKSLKLMPLKKELMMLVMLLPMCVQQMGSFSYDVSLLSICFIYIAYVLHLKFVKEKIFLRDILKLLLLLGIIYLIKIPYVLLGGLLILLPINKLSLKIRNLEINEYFINKYKNKILVVCVFVFWLVSILLLKVLNRVSFGRVLLATFKSGVDTLRLLFNTVLGNGKSYLIQLVGSFGWLEVSVSKIFVIFVLISLILVSFIRYKNSGDVSLKFKKWEIIYLIVLGLFLCLVIILSLFQWTLFVNNIPNCDGLSIDEYVYLIKNNISEIKGVQGRYFIPVIPLFLLPLNNNFIERIIKRINIKFYLVVYYLVTFLYMFIIILNRYWIG